MWVGVEHNKVRKTNIAVWIDDKQNKHPPPHPRTPPTPPPQCGGGCRWRCTGKEGRGGGGGLWLWGCQRTRSRDCVRVEWAFFEWWLRESMSSQDPRTQNMQRGLGASGPQGELAGAPPAPIQSERGEREREHSEGALGGREKGAEGGGTCDAGGGVLLSHAFFFLCVPGSERGKWGEEKERKHARWRQNPQGPPQLAKPSRSRHAPSRS